MDNQLSRTPFPVLLRPASGSVTPFFHFTMIKLESPKAVSDSMSKEVIMYRYFAVLLQEMDINVEEGFILALLAAVRVNSDILQSRYYYLPSFIKSVSSEDTFVIKPSPMIYFDTLHLNPIKLNLSFLSSIFMENINLAQQQQQQHNGVDSVATLLSLPT